MTTESRDSLAAALRDAEKVILSSRASWLEASTVVEQADSGSSSTAPSRARKSSSPHKRQSLNHRGVGSKTDRDRSARHEALANAATKCRSDAFVVQSTLNTLWPMSALLQLSVAEKAEVSRCIASLLDCQYLGSEVMFRISSEPFAFRWPDEAQSERIQFVEGNGANDTEAQSVLRKMSQKLMYLKHNGSPYDRRRQLRKFQETIHPTTQVWHNDAGPDQDGLIWRIHDDTPFTPSAASTSATDPTPSSSGTLSEETIALLRNRIEVAAARCELSFSSQEQNIGLVHAGTVSRLRSGEGRLAELVEQ